ncbi:MAG TPA: amidase [Arsenicitalea sp.]|jgi:aspartyl-tRNA(Asn)/glutamyl-tRNA(Gln) amidotransferase subunit A|nr:amidase [Arsenicitalea sp.]
MSETIETPLWSLTATELANGFRRAEFTPDDVLAAVRARLEAVNPKLNAVIALDWAAAETASTASTARWQAETPRSPLDGVPITVKDNLYARGLPATWGSTAYQGFVPSEDEPAIARLRDAGAIIIGKTNVPEFTLQGYTSNALFGTTFNPHAPDKTPGGSTGGGSAAVASGIGPIAIGTDGGGSLRRPAAHCGLFALKPSIGQIARDGGFPQILGDFEVIGPVARSVEDLSAAFSVLRGFDPRDPRSVATLAPKRAFPKSLRIAYLPSIGDAPIDPQIAAAAEQFAAALATDGAQVERVESLFDLDEINAVWGTIAAMGVAWLLDKMPDRLSGLGGNALGMAETGRKRSAADYIDALNGAARIRSRAGQLFNSYDLLLCPATAALAWTAAEAFPPTIDGKPVGPRGHAIFTAWMNVAGLCAATVPVAMSADGGGIGMQLVAATGRDLDLLDFLTTSPTIRAHSPAGLSRRI